MIKISFLSFSGLLYFCWLFVIQNSEFIMSDNYNNLEPTSLYRQLLHYEILFFKVL